MFCLPVISGLKTDLLSPLFFNNHILHSLTLFTSLLISSLAFWWFHFQPSYQKVWTSSRPSPRSCPRSVFHQPSTKLPASESSLKPVTAVFLPLLWFRSFIARECRKFCPHSPEAKVKFKKKTFYFYLFLETEEEREKERERNINVRNIDQLPLALATNQDQPAAQACALPGALPGNRPFAFQDDVQPTEP